MTQTEQAKQLRQRVAELRGIVKNFRVVGAGVSGNLEKGYFLKLARPSSNDPRQNQLEVR